MPIIDANGSLLEGDWAGFDVVIVGAGAAGIFLAVDLARRRRRVLLIESGHFTETDDRQDLNDLEQSGKRMANALWNRKRVLGGTTTIWGGASLPFSPLDFQKRDWVEQSGWPINYDTLHAHFGAANRFMGIDERNYSSDILSLFGQEHPGFDPALVDYHYCKWATQPNFFKLHKRTLEREVTVLYNAHLLRIDLGEAGRVAQVEIGDFRGRRRAVPVKDLVLATGGIETSRILLLNDHQISGGLGSGSGWLGMAFMEHPCLEGGHVESGDMQRLQESFGTRLRGGRRYSVRLSASAAWQERNRLLNVSASLMWLYAGDDVGPLSELRSLASRPRLDSAIRVTRRGGQLVQGLWALARSGLIYKPGAAAKISLMCEQEPRRDSYITLSDQKDRFGARKARLHWHIGRRTWETVVRFSETLAAELQRIGLGRARLLDSLRVDEPDYESRLSDVNHHMGGARMSASPAEGVVNSELQVWGVPNLYICSAAVFPTASHSNPTLTLLALAARLADKVTAQSKASAQPDRAVVA
jgi:choline dehydrogenase-like flavoprotein